MINDNGYCIENGKKSKYKLGNVSRQIKRYKYVSRNNFFHILGGGHSPSTTWDFDEIKYIKEKDSFIYHFSCDGYDLWYCEDALIPIRKTRGLI